MRVKDVMKSVKTMTKDHTLRQAAQFMSQYNISCVVVISDSQVLGIVTERDVTKQVSSDPSSLEKPVENFLSPNLITVSPDDFIEDAASVMVQNKIKKLPVLEDGRIVGIITSTDLVAHSPDFNNFSVF